MNMHTWRGKLDRGVQAKYMNHQLLKPFSQEWIWEQAIVEPQIILFVKEQLNDYDELVLQWLLQNKGNTVTEQEQLINAMKIQLHISGQQALFSLLSLAEFGVIQCRKHPWKGHMWQMPYPVFHNWRSTINQEFQYWKQSRDLNIAYYTVDQGNMIPLGKTLMYILLAMNKLDLSYTKKGELAKLTREKLTALSASIDNEFLRDHLPHLRKQTYGANLMFFLELAYALQLVEETDVGLKLNMSHINEWLLLHEWQREALHMQWMCEFFLVQPYYESTAVTISELMTCNAGLWYEIHAPSYELQLLLSMWRTSGWLTTLSEKNSEYGTRMFVQRHIFALHSQSQLAIQDNGEIIVMPGTSYRQLWLLEQIAERISEQEIIVYKLTLQSLVKALTTGYPLDQIKQWLGQSCDHDLPQIVIHMLQAARTTYEESRQRVNMSSELFEVNQDKVTVPSLMTSKNEKKVTNCSLLHMEVVFRDALHLLRPIEQWGKWLATTNLVLDEPLLEHEERYELLTMQEYGSITTSWMTECRQYHYSTSKQIVQLAINHQLSLQIKKEGELLYFHPNRMLEVDDKWVVEGVFDRQQSDELQLEQLNDWQGIKLHIATVL
ncbi:helicase-associated domain-containing protein [Paenibacillus endoradicis]|uniref:helicase-associated domain-containing protein n=1 Tax=Paenibacillus endoradicis TaxID=2972487 RepID=UPI0021592CBB|nr:helicase-associated domain-containing protein [Paenibacillus endoradicis]MCR8656099.1 helicase-associated domain-containing protein [Paenibacillus endoradicis]MCR8658425.1 helicase-associated domain-containing protein [Paenibacillus endoradicis]